MAMKRVIYGFALLIAGLMLPGAAGVGADDSSFHINAKLVGFQEVPPNLTDGSGTFSATVTGTSLTYTLRFTNLSAPVTQAHIHFGQPGVNGGVSIFLCGTAAAPGPAGTPTCTPDVDISRTVTAADVIGPTGQGVAAGNFTGVVRFIRAGISYANVHSTAHPGGEIRGAIRVDD